MPFCERWKPRPGPPKSRFSHTFSESADGGSVNPGNVSGFLEEPSIQGTLVGGASLDAEQFCEMVRLTAEVKGRG